MSQTLGLTRSQWAAWLLIGGPIALFSLSRSAAARYLYSLTYATSFRTRKVRSSRKTRTSISACSSGKKSAR